MRSYGFIPGNDREREALARIQNNPNLTEEKRKEIIEGWIDFDRRIRQGLNHIKNLKYFGEPTPEPVAPKAVVYNYADSKEVRATINHLEGRVNELDGFKKMAHSHSKSVRGKYNTYNV